MCKGMQMNNANIFRKWQVAQCSGLYNSEQETGDNVGKMAQVRLWETLNVKLKEFGFYCVRLQDYHTLV